MTDDDLKRFAAQAALQYVDDDTIVGVGTGSTVNYFIEALAGIKHRIDGAVASSIATERLLRLHHIPVLDLNVASNIPLYVDGADEIDEHFRMIKGGGGALTREKIVAQSAKKFICIAHESKRVPVLGHFPLAVEVIPMARGLVARELVKLGGSPNYREGFVTDNGNIILDVYSLNFTDPTHLEEQLNNIVGVVCHGLFAKRPADMLLLATTHGVQRFVRT